jgi:DNA-binding NarL/FixJ family response regulator
VVSVRVLLVDDDALVRAGLRMILSSAPDLELVGEADDGARAVAAVREHRPDVVLMDIRMPEMDGIAATAALRRLDTPPQVIVLTTYQADDQVLSALRAGASGFLLKHTPPAEIVNAVRLVAAGEAMLSPSVTRTLLSHVGNAQAAERRHAATQRLATLTDRERCSRTRPQQSRNWGMEASRVSTWWQLKTLPKSTIWLFAPSARATPGRCWGSRPHGTSRQPIAPAPSSTHVACSPTSGSRCLHRCGSRCTTPQRRFATSWCQCARRALPGGPRTSSLSWSPAIP